MTLSADVKPLSPHLPPGRANRKALAYTGEIQRLRALGYTFEAIRLALVEVGVPVGLTTVKREAKRRAPSLSSPPLSSGAPTRLPAEDRAQVATAPAPEPTTTPNRRSGKAIAEAFALSHVTHPLVRPQAPAADSE